MHFSINKPLVSVVIPNYNHESYLKERIDSVLNQTYNEIEIIILDDHSIDNSWEIISTYSSNIKISHLEKNSENSGSTFFQWEKGIKLAKGNFIWIAESDDVSNLHFLDEVMLVFMTNENLSVVYSGSIMIDENSRKIGDLDWWVSDFQHKKWSEDFVMDGNEFISKYHSVRNVIMNASSAVFKKDSYIINVQNNSNYKLCGDWITWIYMIKDSNVGYVNKYLNNYRFHDKSVREKSNKKNIVFKESFEIRSYCFNNFPIDTSTLNLMFHETYNNILGITSSENTFKKSVNFLNCYIYMLLKDLNFSIRFLRYLLLRRFS